MRMSESFFDYLYRVDLNKQVENDIRILTKKNKKKTYERAMDISKYDKILSELSI